MNSISCRIDFKARVNMAVSADPIINTSRRPLFQDIDGLSDVFCRQGSQIINIPTGSTIENITLGGGASKESSDWAALRGSVMKFDKARSDTPVHIDGKDLEISPGWSLMDRNYYYNTVRTYEGSPGFNVLSPDFESSEPLYLVHSSWCHPNIAGKTLQLFLPQGTFTDTLFRVATSALLPEIMHMKFLDGMLYLSEHLIDNDSIAWINGNIGRINTVNVDLDEGNMLQLMRSIHESTADN